MYAESGVSLLIYLQPWKQIFLKMLSYYIKYGSIYILRLWLWSGMSVLRLLKIYFFSPFFIYVLNTF